ncbi:MAG: 2-phospho-L-lactate guanylyltransferase [Halobacteriales archaeon]
MRFVVPFDAGSPKTRLGPLLAPDERRAFARVMLSDVLATLEATAAEPTVLATSPVDCEVHVEIDDRPLTPAVNAVLEAAEEPVGIVMADLPLLTPDTIERLLAPRVDLVIAAGRGGGTNAFVARHAEFRVDYHGTSYTDHLEIARELGATVETIDSHRLATDIDERADLVEVLIHGSDTRSRDWLIEQGIRLTTDEGRVGVGRAGTWG